MSTVTTQSPNPHLDPGKSSPRGTSKRRARLVAIVGVAALAAGGLGAGLALAAGSGSSSPQGTTAGASSYSYYQSMMGRLDGGSMMGDTYSYGWMMGGTNAPGWMHGGSLPGSMMGSGTDPGKIMGVLFADAPGPRVSPADATRLGNEVPGNATVDKAKNSVTVSGTAVHLVALASPSGGPDETFRIAGLVNPTVSVKVGASVSLEVVNADTDTAHGLVVAATGSASSWMPMMTTRPAFSDSAVWFLGNPTSAGMHTATLSFTATMPGIYQYLCAVPGHAQKGMVGTFVVTA